MIDNVLTLAGMFLFVVAVLWSASRWGRHDRSAREPFERDFLIGLGRGLGLERYTERTYFGEQIQVLAGTFKELGVELEISGGDEWAPYMRMTIEFPEPLAQDLSLYSGSRRPIGSSVRGFEQFEFGEPDFDERFVAFARDQDRAELVLTEAMRYQLMRMNAIVDDLQLTDHSMFVFVGEAMNRQDLKSTLKKAIDLGDRLYQTAQMLGPRAPEKGAGHYEQATIEKSLRTAGTEETDRPGAGE